MGQDKRRKTMHEEKEEERYIVQAQLCGRVLMLWDAGRNMEIYYDDGWLEVLQTSSVKTSGARDHINLLKELYALQPQLENQKVRLESLAFSYWRL